MRVTRLFMHRDPDEERGTGGFGYDPIMFLPEYGMTVAELPPELKDALSHRGKAGRRIARLLEVAGDSAKQ